MATDPVCFGVKCTVANSVGFLQVAEEGGCRLWVHAKALVPVGRVVETFLLAGEAQDPNSSKVESSLCRQVTVWEEELGLSCGF